MQHLTVRNLPLDLATALKTEKHRRQTSLNQTVIDLLRQGLGIGADRRHSNGLARLAGSWSEEEHQEFETAVAAVDQIDEELWR
jgi:plasmid stability protein